MKIKKWNSNTSAWVQEYPEVDVNAIVATGTPSSTTYLRGDGSWATVTAGGGDITSVVAGTGLSGGGTSGDVTLNLDFSELTDITLDVSGTTEMIVAVGATEGRKALSEIKLSAFNNDAGWTSNTGDITSVVAGTGLTGGGTSGGVTLNVDTTVIAPLASPALTGTPTAPTAAANTNTTQIATTAYVQQEITDLIGGAPGALDTLNELAAAINDDSSYASTITTALAGKVAKAGDTMTGNLVVSSSGTIGLTTPTNGYIQVTDGSGRLAFDPNEIYSTEQLNITSNGNVKVNGNDVFTDGYHPNADKWTTARTITLGGDLTGSVSLDGSANVTLSAQVVNNSHTHDYLPLAGGTLTGTLTTRAIAMQNYDITGINSLAFNDPGPNEGISWNGGNFKIYESPDDLTTNSSGNLQFVSGGARRFTIGTSGDLYAGGRFSNGAVWIANGSDNNSYNENIRLFAAPNGVSVIAFNATGTSGTPVSSILGFSDRLEQRIGSTWRTRLYSSGLQVNGTITEAGTALSSKYLGISAKAADSELLDGIDSSAFLRSNADDAMTGDLVLSNAALSYEGQSATVVPIPQGGAFATTSSTQTGYLKITLPVSWTNTMLSFFVDFYEYTNDEAFTMQLCGYNYGSGYWVNTTANLVSASSNRVFNVRFGHDGSKCAIYIGESNSSWSYPQVRVRDFLGGYSGGGSANWADGWAVGFTTTLGTITDTQSLESVVTYADSAGNANTVDGYHIVVGSTGSDANTLYFTT